MNRGELQRWLAGQRPSPHRVVAVTEEGKEESLAFSKGPNRWLRVSNTAFEMKAVGVRLYDKAHALIDQCDLQSEDESDAPLAKGSDALALLSGGDRTFTAIEVVSLLAQAQCRIAEVTASAVVKATQHAMQAQAASNQVAFTQLSEVTKALTDRVKQLESNAQESIERQQAELDDKREEQGDSRIEGVMMNLIEKKLGGGSGGDQLKGILGALGGKNGATDHGEQKK